MPLATFQADVIQCFLIPFSGRQWNYTEYLALPPADRSNDEANAVDQQFTRYLLEWLGFTPADWIYNQPLADRKQDKPDYVIRVGVGVAFIVENKNSSLDLEEKHIQQMRRYSVGTAGYGVWCNMRRVLAVRFFPNDASRYETISDINVEALFGAQTINLEEREYQQANLSLFKLLFGKERFTTFNSLAEKIGVSEEQFDQTAQPLIKDALKAFINSSRESLEHLRLAALAQIVEAVQRDKQNEAQEEQLRQEWKEAARELSAVVAHNQGIVDDALAALNIGEAARGQLLEIADAVNAARGTAVLPAIMRAPFDHWLERAERVNAVYRTLRYQKVVSLRIAEAYRTWSLRQRDPEDVKPGIFAEQVAYVFFVRLLLSGSV